MNAVDPIKSLDDIRKMKEFLAKKPRNALLFSFGINSGLRISDILALNVGDVMASFKWRERRGCLESLALNVSTVDVCNGFAILPSSLRTPLAPRSNSGRFKQPAASSHLFIPQLLTKK